MRRARNYNWKLFLGDCGGGLIAALIALPYGLSMAALMGLPPVLGILTSVLTAPITALLGRNPLLIGGTASATVPFIAAAVRGQGLGGAAKVSLVASVLMMAFCVLRIGRLASKVPHAVVAGFSAGIGGIMLISQFPAILGVRVEGSGSAIAEAVQVIGRLPASRLAPAILSGTVIGAAALCARFFPRVPAPLAGVALSAAVGALLHFHEPEVGSLHLELPEFAGFSWRPEDVLSVVPTGLALAFVTSVNLLMTSRVVEHFRGRHRPLKRSDADSEVGAYGIANLCAAIFGAPMSVGIPARSLAAVRCGGTTRMSNLLHAAFLFLFVKLGSGFLAHIPLAALAGVTAWMGACLLDWSTWRRLSKMRVLDASAFMATAVAVVALNAAAAVLIGCSLYLASYLRGMAAGRLGSQTVEVAQAGR
ncbi:MAG TPA: SulP family inorganic anion transporter [Bryobacteraceae bacterium]|nr:SulP family inorganic anion transporter [Bryobacteraceae bacterium]